MQKVHLETNNYNISTTIFSYREIPFYINSIIYATKTKLGHFIISCYFSQTFFPLPHLISQTNVASRACTVYPLPYGHVHIKPAVLHKDWGLLWLLVFFDLHSSSWGHCDVRNLCLLSRWLRPTQHRGSDLWETLWLRSPESWLEGLV